MCMGVYCTRGEARYPKPPLGQKHKKLLICVWCKTSGCLLYFGGNRNTAPDGASDLELSLCRLLLLPCLSRLFPGAPCLFSFSLRFAPFPCSGPFSCKAMAP